MVELEDSLVNPSHGPLGERVPGDPALPPHGTLPKRRWQIIPLPEMGISSLPGVVRKLLRLQGLMNFGLGSAKTLMIWNKVVWAMRVMEGGLRSAHPSLSPLHRPAGAPEPGQCYPRGSLQKGGGWAGGTHSPKPSFILGLPDPDI